MCRNVFAHKRHYTQQFFTHRRFYTLTRLQTNTLVQGRLYTQTPFTHKCFHTHTQMLAHRHLYTYTHAHLLHTDACTPTPLHTHTHTPFTHRCLYTDTFTRRRLCTGARTHTDTFTHTAPSIHRLLHTDALTHPRFCAEPLLHPEALHTETFEHTEALTHRPFYTQTLVYTHKRFYTHTHTRTHACLAQESLRKVLPSTTSYHKAFPVLQGLQTDAENISQHKALTKSHIKLVDCAVGQEKGMEESIWHFFLPFFVCRGVLSVIFPHFHRFCSGVCRFSSIYVVSSKFFLGFLIFRCVFNIYLGVV